MLSVTSALRLAAIAEPGITNASCRPRPARSSCGYRSFGRRPLRRRTGDMFGASLPKRALSASCKSPVDSGSRLFVRRAHFGRIDEVKRISPRRPGRAPWRDAPRLTPPRFGLSDAAHGHGARHGRGHSAISIPPHGDKGIGLGDQHLGQHSASGVGAGASNPRKVASTRPSSASSTPSAPSAERNSGFLSGKCEFGTKAPYRL